MTIPEYEILCDAYNLKSVDEEFKIHLQAFQNVRANAKKGKGKPAYRKFKDFFDYEKELDRFKKKESKFLGVSKFIKEGGLKCSEEQDKQ